MATRYRYPGIVLVLLWKALLSFLGKKRIVRHVTLVFTSHLLSPTMSVSEIGGEPALSIIKLLQGFHNSRLGIANSVTTELNVMVRGKRKEGFRTPRELLAYK